MEGAGCRGAEVGAGENPYRNEVELLIVTLTTDSRDKMSHITPLREERFMSESKPWHGVIVATALPYTEDLKVDYEAYAQHVQWLAANGCDGVAPNGSVNTKSSTD